MKSSVNHAFFGVLSLILFLFNFGTIRQLVAFSLSRGHEETSQILLVPFISTVMIWFSRKDIFSNLQWSVLPGAVLTLFAVTVSFAGTTAYMATNENDRLSLLTFSVVMSLL